MPLPGNLVALELVSEGAHATYCFRAQPRASFADGGPDPAAIRETVGAISEALVDSRFLREPMALSDEALAAPRFLRYRLALAALPSLADARARFVARLVHRDDASWAAALADLIAWHATTRDEAAIWPGRAAQDAIVDEASKESQLNARLQAPLSVLHEVHRQRRGGLSVLRRHRPVHPGTLPGLPRRRSSRAGSPVRSAGAT